MVDSTNQNKPYLVCHYYNKSNFTMLIKKQTSGSPIKQTIKGNFCISVKLDLILHLIYIIFLYNNCTSLSLTNLLAF